jgi:hypothetical protein
LAIVTVVEAIVTILAPHNPFARAMPRDSLSGFRLLLLFMPSIIATLVPGFPFPLFLQFTSCHGQIVVLSTIADVAQRVEIRS